MKGTHVQKNTMYATENCSRNNEVIEILKTFSHPCHRNHIFLWNKKALEFFKKIFMLKEKVLRPKTIVISSRSFKDTQIKLLMGEIKFITKVYRGQ